MLVVEVGLSVPAEKIESLELPPWVEVLVAETLKKEIQRILEPLPDQLKEYIDEKFDAQERPFDVNQMAEWLGWSVPTVWRRSRDPDDDLPIGHKVGGKRLWSAQERRMYRAKIESLID